MKLTFKSFYRTFGAKVRMYGLSPLPITPVSLSDNVETLGIKSIPNTHPTCMAHHASCHWLTAFWTFFFCTNTYIKLVTEFSPANISCTYAAFCVVNHWQWSLWDIYIVYRYMMYQYIMELHHAGNTSLPKVMFWYRQEEMFYWNIYVALTLVPGTSIWDPGNNWQHSHEIKVNHVHINTTWLPPPQAIWLINNHQGLWPCQMLYTYMYRGVCSCKTNHSVRKNWS